MNKEIDNEDITWKMQQNHSLLKLNTTKRELALEALDGTLLYVLYYQRFSQNGFLKNMIIIFQNIENF